MSRRLITILMSLIACAASSLVASPVQRTFVSTSGLDTNPCSRPQPCRSFAAAIGQTLSGGEVYVLDSGGYGGGANITQAITIRADGVTAGVSVGSGLDGIDINAGPNDVVTLHGLTINGVGGNDGVSFVSGGALHLEDLTVANMNLQGVEMTATGKMDVIDSTFRDNIHNTGLFVHPIGGLPGLVSVDNCRFERNNTGVRIDDGGQAIVRNSIAVSNQSLGFLAETTGGSNALLMLESCLSAENNYGISAQFFGQGAPGVYISNVTVYGNAIGLQMTNVPGDPFFGGIYSFGNNSIDGNLTNGAPIGTIPRM